MRQIENICICLRKAVPARNVGRGEKPNALESPAPAFKLVPGVEAFQKSQKPQIDQRESIIAYWKCLISPSL